MPTPTEQVEADINTFAQSASFPTLEPAEVSRAAELARVADSVGRAPSAAGYVATYNHNLAISLAWQIKAAKVAGNFDFASGNQRFNRSQVYKQCKEQADSYRKKSGVSLSSVQALGAAAVQGIGSGDPLATGFGAAAGGYPPGMADASDVDGGAW